MEQLFSESVEALSAYIEKNVSELDNKAVGRQYYIICTLNVKYVSDPLSLELDMIDGLGSVITLLEHIMTKYDHALPEHGIEYYNSRKYHFSL